MIRPYITRLHIYMYDVYLVSVLTILSPLTTFKQKIEKIIEKEAISDDKV